jgi:hypothetical protein
LSSFAKGGGSAVGFVFAFVLQLQLPFPFAVDLLSLLAVASG